jgi:hypothetical protein
MLSQDLEIPAMFLPQLRERRHHAIGRAKAQQTMEMASQMFAMLSRMLEQ